MNQKKKENRCLFDKLIIFLQKKANTLSHHIMKDKFQQVLNLNDKEDHSNSFKIQQICIKFLLVGELFFSKNNNLSNIFLKKNCHVCTHC